MTSEMAPTITAIAIIGGIAVHIVVLYIVVRIAVRHELKK